MLEQQLINAFMKFSAKAGAGALIRDLIREVEENGNPKSWTPAEMNHAIRFLNQHIETFGKREAAIVIRTLMRKFGVTSEDLNSSDNFFQEDELTGVQGLQ
jgi:hypothetical protein